LVDNCRSELCPCKGWPSAPACGGFGLDKSIARCIVAHHSVNEQERANLRGTHSFFKRGYILEGEIGARVGDEVLQATRGSYVFKPRGLPHTFWNATTQPARLLELISPAGFEKYFAELADLLRAGGDVDQITKLAEKYGMELRMDWVPELCAKYKLKLVGE
jgi:mannose-6-phosphate isomerase-like protein (cupin superfamily)